MTVKVRFAPSPTGKLHLGNIRAALVTWLFARKNKGHFFLRIDDTDHERSKEEYVTSIKADLTWLGLNWDSTARQSERTDRYDELIQKLKDDGRLYPCYETEDELGLKRKSLMSQGKPPLYDRGSLDLSDEQKAQYEAEGRTPHWRFKLNHTPIEWHDHIRGPVAFHGGDLSDPVLIRENGTPLYHLCSVIDDIDFGITHVIRGEDHVANTATHVQMFEALGAQVPEFAHYALLAGKDGGKLSKRLGALSIENMRDDLGLEAMAINSVIAKVGTSDNIDAYSDLNALVQEFDFSKFARSIAKLDDEEVGRINTKLIHDMSYETAKPKLEALGLSGIDEDFWNGVRPNITRLIDVKEWWDIARGEIAPAIEGDDVDYTSQAAEQLPSSTWDETTWDAWIADVKQSTGRKGKLLFMPLRKALTGMEHGPELRVILPLIGPEKATKRLKGTKA